MKKIFLSLSLISVLSAVPSDELKLALSQELSEAKTLIDNGEYESAWSVLTRLVRTEPDNANVNMLMFEAALKTKRINQALAVLERLVSLYPNDAKLRKELANFYASMGDKASAQNELNIAAKLDPNIMNEDTQKEIENRLKIASQANSATKITGKISAGIVYNNNVNAGLDNLDVTVGSLDLRLSDESEKKGAFGAYINGKVNIAHRLGEGNWWAMGTVDIYGNRYFKTTPTNKYLASVRGSAGLRGVFTNDLVDINLNLGYNKLHPSQNVKTIGGDISWIHLLNTNWQTIAKVGLEHRGYSKNDERDGNYWYGGGYLRYLWGERNANYAMLGARYLKSANIRGDYYTYKGYEVLLRTNFELISNKLDFTPFVAYREQRYDAPATRLEEVFGEDNRKDRILLSGAFFTYHFTKNLASELGWQYTKNRSTSDFYRYKQHQFNLGMSYSF